MNIDQLAQEHERDHPGYELGDYYTAALPSYEVYLRVELQVEQPLPVIEQFALRAIQTGLKTSVEIGEALGLEHSIVCDALERLHRKRCLVITHPKVNGKRRELIAITTKGRNVLQKLTFLTPEEDNFYICLDALTGEYYEHRRLFTPKSVRQPGWHQIPPYLGTPTYDELEIIALRRVWRERERTLPKSQRNKELLDLLTVEKAFLGYRPMRILQFIRPDDGSVVLHVYDGIERSPRHEAVLLKMQNEDLNALRAERRRGPERATDPIREFVGTNTYQAAVRKSSQVPELRQNIRKLKQQKEETDDFERTSGRKDTDLADEKRDEIQTKIERLKERIEELESQAPNVQILTMAEHRPKLVEALNDAEERVIIVSPWLNSIAVNRSLRDLIAQRVAEGVEVWIGHGFGEPDHKEMRTLRQLEKIKNSKGGHNLLLCRLEDSHAKVVVCDKKYIITTSFNWLSFAGRPDWGNRVEYGTLTNDPSAVQQMLDEIEPLFADAA